MGDELITSAANPLVKRIRRLAQRRHRRAEQATVVFGIQPVRQAAEAGFDIDTLVVAPELLRAESAHAFVADLAGRGVPVAQLSGELFGRLADRDGPTGLAAVVGTRHVDLASWTPTPAATYLAVDRLANPGNLGTILRTADATGTAGVILVGATADPWDPATIKASMGATFGVPIATVADQPALVRWAHDHGLPVATTAARAPHGLWEIEFPESLVVLLGAEQTGLDDAALAAGDLQVSIPMVGTAESLNVAQAATVLLYEIWRQHS
ncbi:TrmH family RNA methyltransferase [Propionibacteriaceae bacterium Y2011]|uniref:TrmH family RNA methyltransferase n=1 Tax=Microlunatus sp. Y2014 TaxID=3418488 RepID=UPI003B45B259